MNPKIKQRWLKALRSGDYRQGINQLRNEKDQFCCLGVLCNLHAKAHPKLSKTQTNPMSYFGEEGLLPIQVQVWAGLSHADPEITDEELGFTVNLSSLNDGAGLREPMPFNQIADIIEKHL